MDFNQNLEDGSGLFKKFLEDTNFSSYINKFPANMTLNQLKNCTDDDLRETYGISSAQTRVEFLRVLQKYKNNQQSDQESDCSGSECSSLRSQPYHRKISSLVRRQSVHRDILIHRKLSRGGSENKRMHRHNCVKPESVSSCSDVGYKRMKLKNLHLGHSAPDISCNPLTNENSIQNKVCLPKNGRLYFPGCQMSMQKKSRSELSRDNPRVLQQQHLKARRMSVNSIFSSDWSSFPSPSSAFSSGHSSQEAVNPPSESIEESGMWDEFSDIPENEGFPSIFRPRAQSFDLTPSETDSNLTALNEFYRNCFPKAIIEMESKLSRFLERHGLTDLHSTLKSDGSASFVLHQLIQLATDCLEKSQAKQISSSYFSEFVSGIQQLLGNAQHKSIFHCDKLAQMVQELLIIISRPARLLECLEFNPKDFYRKLGKEEMKRINNADVVSYILSKLCIESKNDDSSDTSSNNSSFETLRSPHLSLKELKPPAVVDAKTFLMLHPPQETDFDTLKLISNGAYGAVLLVRHNETKRLFAMKKLLKSDLVLRNMVEQVFAERDILTFTDNPFVVSFYCSFETKKHLCMVLEYVEGGDCGALLTNNPGPFPLDMARLYFAETVLALEYLHNFGIVHRDLKPDNLLITLTGHIKLTDFGLSKIGLMKMTTNLYEGAGRDCNQFLDNQVFGTPEYIAPEVILRQGYGQPVDWWSMGIILYQFLVGCVPFTGETGEEIFSEIISGEILWPEEEEFKVCDEALDIIESLLERDPIDRLGYEGTSEVKTHIFFKDVDWDGLLRQKTQFVPQLADDEDTSYFDMRMDRYGHHLQDSGEDEDEDSDLFKRFSTCSPRYSKTENALFADRHQVIDIKLDSSQGECNIPQQHVENDPQETVDSPYSLLLVPESPSAILKSLPSRTDNKSCSSLHEKLLEGEKHAKKEINLKSTSSLKRQRDMKVCKSSSSSSSLSNPIFTTSRSKMPHRLVRQFSKDSSGSSFDDSFFEPSPKTIWVSKGREGFGFNFRALKVLNEATNIYSLQHIVIDVDRNGPANTSGLCVGDMLTHVDGVSVSGLPHYQVIKLLLHQQQFYQQSRPLLSRKTRHRKFVDAFQSQRKNKFVASTTGSISLLDGSKDVVKNQNIDTEAGQPSEPGKSSQKSMENKAEVANVSNAKEATTGNKARICSKSKSLKLMMMSAWKKCGKAEERAVWYTDNEAIKNEISSQDDIKDKEPGQENIQDDMRCPLSPSSYSVEFKVVPTVKVKKTIKLGKKLSLLSKKKTIDVLMVPKSAMNYQQKGCTRKNRYLLIPPTGECASTPGLSPVERKCSDHLTLRRGSVISPTSHYSISHSSSRSISRPSTLMWGSRRASAGGSLLSPLVLCSSPARGSSESDRNSQSSFSSHICRKKSNVSSESFSNNSPDAGFKTPQDVLANQSRDPHSSRPQFFIAKSASLEHNELLPSTEENKF